MVQREEIRRKVMNHETQSRTAATRGYNVKTMPHSENSSSSMLEHAFFIYISKQVGDSRSFKGKRSELKCSYCHNTGHLTDRCWQLHPELKPRFSNEERGLQKRTNYKAHLADSTLSTNNFTVNPATLMQDFANYLQDKHNHEKMQSGITRTAG
jgi:hypothetical protein